MSGFHITQLLRASADTDTNARIQFPEKAPAGLVLEEQISALAPQRCTSSATENGRGEEAFLKHWTRDGGSSRPARGPVPFFVFNEWRGGYRTHFHSAG